MTLDMSGANQRNFLASLAHLQIERRNGMLGIWIDAP
jgi:hypothetical protein